MFLFIVKTENVRTFFNSTQSQESKSEVCTQEFHVAMHIDLHIIKFYIKGRFGEGLLDIL